MVGLGSEFFMASGRCCNILERVLQGPFHPRLYTTFRVLFCKPPYLVLIGFSSNWTWHFCLYLQIGDVFHARIVVALIASEQYVIRQIFEVHVREGNTIVISLFTFSPETFFVHSTVKAVLSWVVFPPWYRSNFAFEFRVSRVFLNSRPLMMLSG